MLGLLDLPKSCKSYFATETHSWLDLERSQSSQHIAACPGAYLEPCIKGWKEPPKLLAEKWGASWAVSSYRSPKVSYVLR